MLQQIKEFFKFGSEKGLHFPYAHDAISGKPSVTLFFAYISFIVAVISLILLHFFKDLLTATSMSFGFTAMMIIFYLIRTLNKVKVDLDDKSVELENNEKDENNG